MWNLSSSFRILYIYRSILMLIFAFHTPTLKLHLWLSNSGFIFTFCQLLAKVLTWIIYFALSTLLQVYPCKTPLEIWKEELLILSIPRLIPRLWLFSKYNNMQVFRRSPFFHEGLIISLYKNRVLKIIGVTLKCRKSPCSSHCREENAVDAAWMSRLWLR